MEEKKEQIRLILSELLGYEIDELNEMTSFFDFEGWDSLLAISLLAACEEEFHVQIPMSKMANINTVGDLLNEIG